MSKACGQLVLRLLYVFSICLYLVLCIHTYHMHNNYMYIMYIVAMQLHCSQLWMAPLSTSVTTMCSLVQLRVGDTENQGQHRRDNIRPYREWKHQFEASS